MKYYIQRDLNEYGPYTLADLQRYVAQGNIAVNDLTRSEGMTEWVPVSQVIGNIPVAVPSTAGTVYGMPGSPGTPSYGTATPYQPASVYSGTPGYSSAMTGTPVPPDFHWALVLLISFFCGIFQLVWLFVENSFIRKLNREDNSLLFLLSGMGLQVVAAVILVAVAVQHQGDTVGFTLVFWAMILGGAVLQIMSYFKMRNTLVEYYNTVEPINLRLSGVMTFFFPVFYFQYHFSRIANWKKTGYLMPQ